MESEVNFDKTLEEEGSIVLNAGSDDETDSITTELENPIPPEKIDKKRLRSTR